MAQATFKIGPEGRVTFYIGLNQDKLNEINAAFARINPHYKSYDKMNDVLFDAVLALAAMLDAGLSTDDLDAMAQSKQSKILTGKDMIS